MAAQLATVRKDLRDPSYKEYLVRPPGGAGRGNPYFWEAARVEQLRIVMWTVSSGGTSDAYSTSPARVKAIMNSVNRGMLNKSGNLIGGTIVLEHTRPADVAALPTLINEIKAKGGRFGLVGDIVGRPDAATAISPWQTTNNVTEVFAKKPELEDQQDIFNAAA